MSKIIVDHYGVHRDPDNIAWLLQGKGGANVSGVKGESPFYVQTPPGSRHCNTQININAPLPHEQHWALFMQLQSDPLIRAMMPFPKADAGIWYVDEEPRIVDYLVMISRMSSPIFPVVLPFYALDRTSILKALGENNIQPLAVFGATVTDVPLMREAAIAGMHRPRRLVMSGIKDVVLPTTVTRIKSDLPSKFDFNELNALPWETLGGTALRKWMRREWAAEKTVLIRPAHAPPE